MNEQREFLDRLKDPELYGLNKALEAFEKEHGHMLYVVRFWLKEVNTVNMQEFREWHIEMVADNIGAVIALSKILPDYIIKYNSHAKINQYAYTTEDTDGFHSQTYSVAF